MRAETLLIFSLMFLVSTPAVAASTKADQERQEIRKMAQGILGRLYKAQPSATAAINSGAAVAPGVWLYQLTETGLALELTAKGTKYYKNDDLN